MGTQGPRFTEADAQYLVKKMVSSISYLHVRTVAITVTIAQIKAKGKDTVCFRNMPQKGF